MDDARVAVDMPGGNANDEIGNSTAVEMDGA
jgi:hypothetical protein